MEIWNFLTELLDRDWPLHVFLVVLITLVIGSFVRVVIAKLSRKSRSTENVLDDALFDSLVAPARGLVWIVGLSSAAHIVGGHSESIVFDSIGSIRNVGIVLMLTWFSQRFIRSYIDLFMRSKSTKGEHVDTTLVLGIGKLLRGTVAITAALIVLQNLGVNIGGLLAFGGVGGIAIGLAAQDICKNMFGGFTIYFDRHFAVGDWIRSPDRDIEGTVEQIGWRTTAIRTFNKRLLYIPNSIFTTIALENPSRMSHRRIYEHIGVRYDDIGSLSKILNEIKAYLRKNTDIDQNQTLMVNLDEFADSSVNFFIYAMTHTTNWSEYHQVKERVMFEINGIIERNNAEIAFPTRTLHINNETALNELR
ncbi:mechanosensitive ion channel family protein [Burkholderiales bacterium]|nr:mechanosensitive ion channel family protein [Burkholderiales bacterium]